MSDDPDLTDQSQLTDEEVKIDEQSIQALQKLREAKMGPFSSEPETAILQDAPDDCFSFKVLHSDLANALLAVQLPTSDAGLLAKMYKVMDHAVNDKDYKPDYQLYNKWRDELQRLTISVVGNECTISNERDDVICQTKLPVLSTIEVSKTFTLAYRQFEGLFSQSYRISQSVGPSKTAKRKAPPDFVDLEFNAKTSALWIKMNPSKKGVPQAKLLIETDRHHRILPDLFAKTNDSLEVAISAPGIETGIRRTAIATTNHTRLPQEKSIWIEKDRVYSARQDLAALYQSRVELSPKPFSIPVESRVALAMALRRFGIANMVMQDGVSVIRNDILAVSFPTSTAGAPSFHGQFESPAPGSFEIQVDRHDLIYHLCVCAAVTANKGPLTLALIGSDGDNDEPTLPRSHDKMLELLDTIPKQGAQPIVGDASLLFFARNGTSSATSGMDASAKAGTLLPTVIKVASDDFLKAVVGSRAERVSLVLHERFLILVSAEPEAECRFLVPYLE